MKYSIGILTMVTLTAAFILSGCDNKSNKVDRAETNVAQAEQDLENANRELDAELREFRTENAERIDEFNRKINEIEQKIENESDDEIRKDLKKKLDELEESYSDLKNEMNNYKAAGRDNWEEFKDSFANKMDDLGDSLDNFFSPRTTTSPKN